LRLLFRKGDLASPVIMWIAVLSVALIVVSWYVTSIRPLHGESSVIEYDLRQLFVYVDNACNSASYSASYNPRMNYGVVEFNKSRVCISTESLSSCMDLTCPVEDFVRADLDEIVNLRVVRQDGVLTIGVEEFS